MAQFRSVLETMALGIGLSSSTAHVADDTLQDKTTERHCGIDNNGTVLDL